MILLQLSDFKGGKYDIPDAAGVYTNNNVQEMIDRYEKLYIYILLGVTTGELLITYIQANYLPANIHYDKIINVFATDNANAYCSDRFIMQSMGLKEYLKAAIFYEYIKNGLITSQPGVTKPESETAIQQGPSSTMRFAENKFNDVLDTVEAIQWYCSDNTEAFPDYKGARIIVRASNLI